MGLKSSNKVETNRYELEISVDKELFAEAVSAAFKKNAKNINVPGFRKGKAPRPVIERFYGEGVFYEDAVNALYPQAYDAAVKEAGLEPVDRADVEIVNVSKDGFDFKAKVTVRPEVGIGAYKGLKAVKNIYAVSDGEVEHELSHVQDRNARLITVEDRAAQKGDTAVIDYEGSVDGVPFDGGQAEKQELVLGSDSFIPGFEQQVEGHKTGEEFDITVTFPKEYHAEQLAGKEAVFKIKLHEIKGKELPELDDEFAKDVSEFDTLVEYKEDIKKHLQEAKDRKSDNDLDDALIDQVLSGLKADIPEVMFEHSIDTMVSDFDYRLQAQGLNVKTYLQYTGMEMDAFRKTFREQAERQVRIRLALEKIAEIENLEATEEELDAEYKKLAEQYKVELDKIKTAIAADDIKKDIVVGKAVDLLHAEAKIQEKEAKEEEKEPETEE
jgi:trigger factor